MDINAWCTGWMVNRFPWYSQPKTWVRVSLRCWPLCLLLPFWTFATLRYGTLQWNLFSAICPDFNHFLLWQSLHSSRSHPVGESAAYFHLVRMHHCLASIAFPVQMAELRTMLALAVHRILQMAAKLRLIHWFDWYRRVTIDSLLKKPFSIWCYSDR